MNKLESLLRIRGWEKNGQTYNYRQSIDLDFPENSIIPQGRLSPSSLKTGYGCERQLFFSIFSNHPEAKYETIYGTQEVFDERKISVAQISGNIIHKVFYYFSNHLRQQADNFEGITWNEILAPVLYHSTLTEFQKTIEFKLCDINYLNHVEFPVTDYLHQITEVIDKYWLNKFLEERINARDWHHQLSRLPISGEVPLEREGMVGVCDSIIDTKSEAVIIDYKTGNVPIHGRKKYSSQETLEVLNNPSDPLFNYVMQISCYCWMHSVERDCTKGYLVFTKEEPLIIMQFEINDRCKQMIRELVESSKEKQDEVSVLKIPPMGTYHPLKCGFCKHRLNCEAFFSGCLEIDIDNWINRNNRSIPMLLSVKSVNSDKGEISTEMNSISMNIRIKNPWKMFMRFIDDRLTKGHQIRVFLRLWGSSHGYSGEDVIFFRC